MQGFSLPRLYPPRLPVRGLAIARHQQSEPFIGRIAQNIKRTAIPHPKLMSSPLEEKQHEKNGRRNLGSLCIFLES